MATNKPIMQRVRDCTFRHPSTNFNLKMEYFFFRLGRLIGTHPVITLVISLLVCAAAGSGILSWKEEIRDMELFIPPSSTVREDAAWVESHFKNDINYESVIVVADNVLAPEVILAIAELDAAVRNINVSGQTWTDVCARYGAWFNMDSGNDTGFMEFVDEILGPAGGGFENGCIHQSLLKVWSSDLDTISSLTQDEILTKLTEVINQSSTISNVLQDVGPLLAGVEWDENGRLVKAKATLLHWMLTKSNTWAPDWELEFIKQALNSNRTLPPGMKIYAIAERSYKDILNKVLDSNMTVLFAGFSLIIFYVIIMLGRCNLVEQRVYLSLFGVSVVGQSILASYGFCFYMGLFYGPIHPILPFLLLGIGVDDMFVIMQSLDNLSNAEKRMDVPDRIGRALQQAGASITVTSLTDVAAFAIGTTTVMPSLRSFCLFAACGILFLYLFEVTFFVSCVAIDEYRIKDKRDGCICTIHRNWKPNDCSQRNIQKLVFGKFYGPFLLKTPVKILVTVTTLLMLGFNIWCLSQVEQKFDPIWYLNPDSYPMQYSDALKQYFPKHGKRAGIYLGEIDYFSEKDKLNDLMALIQKNPYINKDTVDFWYESFEKWLSTHADYEPENADELNGYLIEFLFLTNEGKSYIKDIKFDLASSQDFRISASQLTIQYILMNTTAEQVHAMKSMRELVSSINFTSGDRRIVAYSPEYVTWIANQVIGEELLRNLSLTIAAVAMVTIVLINNIQTSLWVICCVGFTLIDLVGSMYLFGLTIEISTSIVILLCVGLAVDYSAHVGHKFTCLQGSKDERALETLVLIGPAVLNGGLSTFLAFVMLGNSDSYIFSTFFKLFFSVVVYGLFHGLFFLPVILSWLGPQSSNTPGLWNDKLYTVPMTNCNGYFQPSVDMKINEPCNGTYGNTSSSPDNGGRAVEVCKEEEFVDVNNRCDNKCKSENGLVAKPLMEEIKLNVS